MAVSRLTVPVASSRECVLSTKYVRRFFRSLVDASFFPGLSERRHLPPRQESLNWETLASASAFRTASLPWIGFAWNTEGVTQMRLAMKLAALAGLLVAGFGQSAHATGYCSWRLRLLSHIGVLALCGLLCRKLVLNVLQNCPGRRL